MLYEFNSIICEKYKTKTAVFNCKKKTAEAAWRLMLFVHGCQVYF